MELFRQSSFWLKPETVPPKEPVAMVRTEAERSESLEARAAALHQPSSGLEDYIDEDGNDRRIGIASSSGSLSDEDDPDALPKHWFTWKKLWLYTGPGFLMSIAYLVRSPACLQYLRMQCLADSTHCICRHDVLSPPLLALSSPVPASHLSAILTVPVARQDPGKFGERSTGGSTGQAICCVGSSCGAQYW